MKPRTRYVMGLSYDWRHYMVGFRFDPYEEGWSFWFTLGPLLIGLHTETR